MIAIETMVFSGDSELVQRSLLGDREAFGQIVSRYQALICSLAYSATGSLSQSEDLAQIKNFYKSGKSIQSVAFLSFLT